MRVLSEKYRKLFLLQNFQDQMQQRSRTFCRCLWVHCVTVPGSQCPGWIRSLPDTGCMYSCVRVFRLPGCRWSLQRTDPCRPAALPCRSGGDLQLSRAVRSTAMGIASLHLPRFSGWRWNNSGNYWIHNLTAKPYLYRSVVHSFGVIHIQAVCHSARRKWPACLTPPGWIRSCRRYIPHTYNPCPEASYDGCSAIALPHTCWSFRCSR